MSAQPKIILRWAFTIGLGAYYAYLSYQTPNAGHWSSDADLIKMNCSVVERAVYGEMNTLERYCPPNSGVQAEIKAYRNNPTPLPAAEKRSPEAWVQYELTRFDSARAQLDHWRAIREQLGCAPQHTEALLPILERIPSENSHNGRLSVVPYNTYMLYDNMVCTVNSDTLQANNGLYWYRFRANQAGKMTLQPKITIKNPLTEEVQSYVRSFPLRIRPTL